MVSTFCRILSFRLVFLSIRQFLGFLVGGRAWFFQALCFILSSAPKVLAWVILLYPPFLFQSGVWILHCLDDWLPLALSRGILLG